MNAQVEAMKDWFRVWSVLQEPEDKGELEFYEEMRSYWYELANRLAQGAVIERRLSDDLGRRVTEMYAHRSLLEKTRTRLGGAWFFIVYKSLSISDLDTIRAYWEKKIKDVEESGLVVTESFDNIRAEGTLLLVREELVLSQTFDVFVHPHKRN